MGVAPATLCWRHGQPANTLYDDVYFSKCNGLAETTDVFFRGNGLPVRWRARDVFSIGETGFGTGLNFFATLALWKKTSPPNSRLHYTAVEKHPLPIAAIKRALSPWAQLTPYLNDLITIYPEPIEGVHRRQLCQGRVVLTLLLGDATTLLSEMNGQVDAWYLDGFAPKKNPEMWSDELFLQLARLSHKETTFSTYTAAGMVKRGLAAAGFSVFKVPGFGAKKDRLQGQLEKTVPPSPLAYPWFEVPKMVVSNKQVAIIGGGIAGVTLAHEFAQRDWKVDLIERQAQPATEASGNPAGVILPLLSVDMNKVSLFFTNAFQYTVAWLNKIQQRCPNLEWRESGVLQLLTKEKCKLLVALGLPETLLSVVDERQASAMSGVKLNQGGLFFPKGGWLHPKSLCHTLLMDKPNITPYYFTEAVTLRRENERWHILDINMQCVTSASVVIIATGAADVGITQIRDLPLRQVRGQISILGESLLQQHLRLPICYDGYITPASNQRICIGATYDADQTNSEVTRLDHRQNLHALHHAIPSLPLLNDQEVQGRVAFRATSIDHVPLIGPLHEAQWFRQNYEDLRHGKPAGHYRPAEYLPGLYVSLGHGSRGLTVSPLAAQIVADYVEGVPHALPRSLLRSCHPARFLIRALKRGESPAL